MTKLARILASASDDGMIRLWSVEDFNCLGILEKGRKDIISLATDGTYLYAGSTGDLSVNVYSLTSWKLVATLVLGGNSPRWNYTWGMVATSDDSVYVASIIGDINIFTKGDWHLAGILKTKGVQKIEIQGNKLFSLETQDFKQWDLFSGQVEGEFAPYFDTYNFTVDGDYLYTGAEVYYIPERRKIALLYPDEIHAVAVDERYIYSGVHVSKQALLSIREKMEPEWPIVIELPNGFTESLAIDKDRVYSGEWDNGQIHVWSKHDWSLIAELNGHEKAVRSLVLLDKASTTIPEPAVKAIASKKIDSDASSLLVFDDR